MFQLFFATDYDNSLVVYLYADDNFQFEKDQNNVSSMGLDVCSDSWTHPGSETSNITGDLVTSSNVNIPGMWMFLIKSSIIITPGKSKSA